MKYVLFLIKIVFLLNLATFGQQRGNLFIIGGGDRSPRLIQTLIATARLSPKDYIIVLTMASSQPDSAYQFIKSQLEAVCANTIKELNFSKKDTSNKLWLDSLQQARLIFIAGGDQNRFMHVVFHNSIQGAIIKAYNNGSTIAGTSAGAAVMCTHMITGNHLLGDTTYHETFRQLRDGNIEMQDGLGLLNSAIIDQHFIVRSRYNRLLSALAKYPRLSCIGIDEGTAIIVHGKKVKVTGESQVVLLSDPKNLKTNVHGFIEFDDARISIYADGDSFLLK